jgi:hypothetical protein
MDDAIAVMDAAVSFKNPIDSQQSAIDVERAALDLQMQYGEMKDVELGWFELLTKQVLVDADDGEELDVAGDVATLERMLERFGHTLDSSVRSSVEGRLRDLREAAHAEDLGAASGAATALREALPAP